MLRRLVRVTQLRAVIFDLDGTLVDQDGAAGPAVAEWAAELGLDPTRIVERWRDIANRHYARYQAREITFQEQRRERVRELLGTTLGDAEADALFDGYLHRYEAGWTVFDDAISCLERAHQAGWGTAILTNGERSQQVQKITRLGLKRLVDEIVCSSDLPAAKPDPRAFQTTLARLGVEAEHALMVGDGLENDVLGARGAGMNAVLIDRFATQSEKCTIRSLDELIFEPYLPA